MDQMGVGNVFRQPINGLLHIGIDMHRINDVDEGSTVAILAKALRMISKPPPKLCRLWPITRRSRMPSRSIENCAANSAWLPSFFTRSTVIYNASMTVLLVISIELWLTD